MKKMSYYHLKNLEIDKQKGTIKGSFAESNISPLSYFRSEIKGDTFHEK